MYTPRTHYKKGQVMLTVVIFFLFLSITIVLGIATPILKQVATARDNYKSKKSYYLAESAIEDVLYRLQTNKVVGATETLSLDGGQATVSTANTFAGKQITAVGDNTSNIRKIQTNIARGTGVVFRYGTQSGQGGFILENNSRITGTLFSNGDIYGANGAVVTGDVFVAGDAGIIDNVDIGGIAWANTVRNSDITGANYCHVGSNNNKACNTSQTNPEPIDLPIKDEEIAQWQADAAAGGVTTGDVTISSPTTLGPRKIVGNLTINNTLTIANTLWVTGNIIINGTVRLSSSYGAASGVVVADGYIDISNGVQFFDSGTAGSYILLLSNSTCDSSVGGLPCSGKDAITVGNNSNIIIANAQKGTVYFSNNSSVKEAVGNKIKLKNNSTISYGSGLINVNFTSGPSGGYNVVDWGEIQ